MGIRDWFGPRRQTANTTVNVGASPEIAIAADYNQIDVAQTFNDRNITYTGDLTGFNYVS